MRRPRAQGLVIRGLAALLLLVTTWALPADAGQERYDYDALGRLIRVIDEQGRVTEYVYDAAGNLLRMIVGGTAQAPTVTAVTPASLRRGDTASVQITGTGLSGTTVSPSDAGLRISNVSTTDTQASFTLTALLTAALGPQSLTLTNAEGSAVATITINPQLPRMLVSPAPLAVPPDSVARQFTLRLSNTDTIAHTIGLSVTNTTIATVSPASITIPAGQTEVQASVTGLKAGLTAVTLTSTTLGTTSVPIFVTAEFRGINSSVASLLGVVIDSTTLPKPPTTITPLRSAGLGVAFGGYLQGLSPSALAIGTGPTTLVVSGAGLDAATAVAISPADGVTVGPPTPSADGLSLSVPVTVAATAPTTLRRVIVTTASGSAFTSVTPTADRLLITVPPPQVTSVDPLFATPGATVPLTIRGKNLQRATAVTFSPGTGLTVGASLSVSTDGTVLTTALAVGLTAPLGAKTVTVTTPAGTSDAATTAANTFTVVNEIRGSVTPIESSALGVVLQSATPPPTGTSLFQASPALGVSFGGVATQLSPASGVIGTGLTLTVRGLDLQGVTIVRFAPATGITVGAPSPAADGLSVTVPVTVAADAPQTLRTVQVLAGTTSIAFADPRAALFRVTPPQPRLDSIDPLALQIGGATVTLTLRGANFQNATQVKVLPPDNLTIGAPSASSDGTVATVSISAAAGAAAGNRAVTIVTPAGETPATLTPANTLRLATTIGPAVTPIESAALGVVVQPPPAPPPSTTIGPVQAPPVGVVLQSATPPPAPVTVTPLTAPPTGVVLGTAAFGIAPTGLIRGAADTLTITGVGLTGVTAVSVVPPDGITLGAPAVSADGTQVSVSTTVASTAPVVKRQVVVTTASGRVAFADPRADRLGIGAGVPRMDSITPILANQGQKVTLTVRGGNFQNALAVTATPPEGITFAPTLTVDPTGTIITIDLFIASDAPLGSRVIQVVVPGAVSTSDAVPANTFTVYPP